MPEPRRLGQGSIRARPCKATLRPYQETGVRWLYLLTQLGLGACLADDMGLGKTIQVLALLLTLSEQPKGSAEKTPSLLVAPASLLANWALEAARFTPRLKIVIAHPSFHAADELGAMSDERLAETDLVVTSYATLLRLELDRPNVTGASWCSTKRRRSRTPTPSRRGPSNP